MVLLADGVDFVEAIGAMTQDHGQQWCPAGGAAVSVALAELLAEFGRTGAVVADGRVFGPRAGAGHQSSDAQCLRDAGADRADRPHPAAAGVGAVGSVSR